MFAATNSVLIPKHDSTELPWHPKRLYGWDLTGGGGGFLADALAAA
jgi:hypothetical protein